MRLFQPFGLSTTVVVGMLLDVRSLAINYRNIKYDWSKVVVEKRSDQLFSYEEAVVHMTSCTTTENETDNQGGILNSTLGPN